MPLFRCENCGSIENTALSNFWIRTRPGLEKIAATKTEKKALCSECDPDIAAWHGEFSKQSAEGCYVDDGGFLWRAAELDQKPAHIKLRGRIVDGKEQPL